MRELGDRERYACDEESISPSSCSPPRRYTSSREDPCDDDLASIAIHIEKALEPAFPQAVLVELIER